MLVVSTVASPDGTGAQKITKIHEEMYICIKKTIQYQGKFQGPPFPYYSHKNPLKYGNGTVWEAYRKGVPLLGVPRKIPYNMNHTNSLRKCLSRCTVDVKSQFFLQQTPEDLDGHSYIDSQISCG